MTRRLRRWLAFQFTRTLPTMAPTRIDCVYPIDNPDERQRAPSMYLARGDDALVMHTAEWLLAGILAASKGGWQPVGTDAADTQFSRGYNRPALAGHYVAVGQTVADSDARAFARGLRRAADAHDKFDRTQFKLTRWFASSEAHTADIVFAEPLAGLDWDLFPGKASKIAAFLDGGACKVVAGFPQKVLDDLAEQDRRNQLDREARRLEAELEEGPAKRLAQIRSQLAAAEKA